MSNYTYKKPITLNCRVCDEEVKNCGSDATAVTCWRCVTISLENDLKNTGDVQDKPRDSEERDN